MNSAALPKNYITEDFSIRSWLFTRDHKRIALMYMGAITFFFLIGGLAALVMRLELLTPQGDVVSAETYNKLFTLHGVTMVFFFLIPSIPAVLGNFFLPMMVGAKDMAFPRLNLASFYIYFFGGLFTMAAGIFIAGFSSILTGLNFVVTTHRMRAPGLTWFRLPLFVWAMYATSIIF